MSTPPRLSAPWLDDPALGRVWRALGGQAVAVGGCVRNTLLGRAVADVDLATPLPPPEVRAALVAAGLRAVPTGIAHGTITAVAGARSFEITTFRADIATDGRHAQVRFTTDLATDAGRRDFTINALYARPDGQVLDPLGGLPDLAARRVRFIGAPRDRIAEDYLRILRFFRVHAWYGDGPLDGEGLAAATALADGLGGLSRERVGAEVRKLLAAPDPVAAVQAMAAAGVLARVLPGAVAAGLAPLVAAERAAALAPDWRLRLAALGGHGVAAALRLARAESLALAHLRALAADPGPVAQAAYRRGAWAARGAALLAGAADWGHVEAEAARGAAARLPLTAADLIARGLAPGPDLGATLRAAERAWIASDFRLDTAALLDQFAPKGHND